jgi:TP901 family phage tail tape measure protein
MNDATTNTLSLSIKTSEAKENLRDLRSEIGLTITELNALGGRFGGGSGGFGADFGKDMLKAVTQIREGLDGVLGQAKTINQQLTDVLDHGNTQRVRDFKDAEVEMTSAMKEHQKLRLDYAKNTQALQFAILQKDTEAYNQAAAERTHIAARTQLALINGEKLTTKERGALLAAYTEMTRENALEVVKTSGHLEQFTKKTNEANGALRANKELLGDAHSAARGLSGALGMLWMTWGSSDVILRSMAVVVGTLREMVVEGKNLEYQTALVRGITSEYITMKDVLQSVKGSMFTPKEATEGLYALAQAGMSAKDSLAALPAVMSLAVVGDVKMGDAAQALTSIMHSFRMDKNQIGEIGDVIAKTAAISSTSVSGVMESMKQASTVGDRYNISLQETSAALTVLANRGIVNTSEGTAFRNAMNELAVQTQKGKAVIHELNLELNDSFGKLKPLPDLLTELRNKMSNLNDKSLTEALDTMFGERGSKFIAPIMKDVDEFKRALEEIKQSSGFMTVVQAEAESTMEGSLRKLKSTWQASLDEAFMSSRSGLKQLIDDLNGFVSSQGFISFLRNTAEGLGNLAKGVAEHAEVIKLLVLGYLGLKSATLVLQGMTIVSELWHTVTKKNTLAQNALDVATRSATGAIVSQGATISASGLSVSGFASVASKLTNVLGIVVATLGLGYTAWEMFRSSANSAKSEMDANVDAMKNVTERLAEHNKAMWKAIELRDEWARKGLPVPQEISNNTPIDAVMSKVNGAQRTVDLLQTAFGKLSFSELATKEGEAIYAQLEAAKKELVKVKAAARKELAALAESAAGAAVMEAGRPQDEFNKALATATEKAYQNAQLGKQGAKEALEEFKGMLGKEITNDAMKVDAIKQINKIESTYTVEVNFDEDSYNAAKKVIEDKIKLLESSVKDEVDNIKRLYRAGSMSEAQYGEMLYAAKMKVQGEKPLLLDLEAKAISNGNKTDAAAARDRLAVGLPEKLKAAGQELADIYEKFSNDTDQLVNKLAEGSAIASGSEVEKAIAAFDASHGKALKLSQADLADALKQPKASAEELARALERVVAAESKLKDAQFNLDNTRFVFENPTARESKFVSDTKSELTEKRDDAGRELELARKAQATLDRVLTRIANDKRAIAALEAARVDAINKATTKDDFHDVQIKLGEYKLAMEEIQGKVNEAGGGWVARLLGAEESYQVRIKYLDQIKDLIAKAKLDVAKNPDKASLIELDKLEQEFKKAADTIDPVWKDVVKNIDSTFHQGFQAMFTKAGDGWKNFTKSLAATFKTTVADAIYQMFVRPIALSLVATLAGSLGATGVANAANAAAQNGMNLWNTGSSAYNAASMYSNWSGAGSYLSTASGATYGTNALSAQSLQLAGQRGTGAYTLGTANTMTNGASASFGAADGVAKGAAVMEGAEGVTTSAIASGTETGFLASIPGWGWAAMAALAIAGSGMFDSKGGPKSGGSASTMTNGTRDFDRSFTPDSADSDLSKVISSAQSTYTSIASKFGVNALPKFALGYDTDPQGTAQNRYTYSGSVLGSSFGNHDVNDGRGDAAGTVAHGLNAMLLDAFQHTDMGPVANAIVRGLDPTKITDTEMAKVQAALAGAADLFGMALTPLQNAIEATKNTAKDLSLQFKDAGVAGSVSAASIKAAVSALDLSTEEGKKAATNMLALIPATKAYGEQLLALAGLTSASLTKSLTDAIANSPDAATAGETFATGVMDSINNAVYGSFSQQLVTIITEGMLQPILDAAVTQQGITEILSQSSIDKMVEKAKATATAFGAIWNDPGFQQALSTIKQGIKDVAVAGMSGIPAAGFGTSTKYDNAQSALAKSEASAAQSEADKEATRVKNLRDLMEQVGDALAKLDMGPMAVSIYDANIAARDSIQKAQDLKASELELGKVRALEAAKIAKLIQDGLTSAYSSRLSLTDTAEGGRFNAMLLQAERDKAFASPLNDGSVTPANIEDVAINNWSKMSGDQQAAMIDAYNTQTKYMAALKNMFDTQLKEVEKVQGWINAVTDFKTSIDDAIFNIKFNLPGADQQGMLKTKEAELWDKFNAPYAGGNKDEYVQDQIKLAGQLKDVTLQRYQIETANATKLLDFSKTTGDYLKNLKLGALSPLTRPEKVLEAKKQYDEVLATLMDASAPQAAKDVAMGKLTSKSDALLQAGRDVYASGEGYTTIYDKVTSDLTKLGADTGTDAERQLAATKALGEKAGATISELQKLGGLADGALKSLGAIKSDAVTKLGDLAKSLSKEGWLQEALVKDLPRNIAEALDKVLNPTQTKTFNETGMNAASKPEIYAAQATKPSIQSLIDKALNGDMAGAFKAAKTAGYNADDVTSAWNQSHPEQAVTADSVRKAALDAGIPGFAAGGDHKGGLRKVGERGVEIEATGPTRIWNAQQTKSMLSGGPEVAAAIEALMVEVRQLREENARQAELLAEVIARSSEANAELVSEAVTRQPRQTRGSMALL